MNAEAPQRFDNGVREMGWRVNKIENVSGSNIFYTSLNDVCIKYFTTFHPLTSQDVQIRPRVFGGELASLFEQLMLFDCINLKVYGENIVAAFLLNQFGERVFEELIEQQALRFTLWTPMVGTMVENVAGLETLVSGSLNSPAHSDPEKSIELGLNWLSKPLRPKQKKKLIKKILPLYDLPKPDLASASVQIVKSAFMSGRMSPYGLDPNKTALDNMTPSQKETLVKSAQDILEYRYLVDGRMTSLSEYKFFSPFATTIERLERAQVMSQATSYISEIERVPNLKQIANYISDPLTKIPRLRNKRNVKKYRSWLLSASNEATAPDVVKSYIESVSEKRGLLESVPLKLVRSISTVSMGIGIGAWAAGPEAAIIGAASSFGIDLLDRFVIDAVTPGWSPKLFFDEVGRIRDSKGAAR